MFRLLLSTFLLISMLACTKENQDSNVETESVAQSLGDAMSAIDESGGADGGYALIKTDFKHVAKFKPQPQFFDQIKQSVLPRAVAATCGASSFGACSSNQIVRDYQGCTLGFATFSGTVTLNYDDGTVDNVCTIDSDGDSITRVPDYTITTTTGATFTVAKTGSVGQKITRTSAGAFSFTNDGIRRVITYNGSTISDWTTSTTSAIQISGTSRNGRVVNSGVWRVANNLSGEICEFIPNSVTWDNTCNCAISGSWAASCDSGTGTFNISGCGAGTLTIGSQSETVSLNRCYSTN